MKIKFSTLLMALPLMALVTSCAESDVVEHGSSSAEISPYISFDVQTQRNTRGNSITTPVLQNTPYGKFWIYSIYTGDKTWKETLASSKFNVADTNNPNPFNEPDWIYYYDKRKAWDVTGFKLWPANGKTTFIAGSTASGNLNSLGLTKATATAAPYLSCNLLGASSSNEDFIIAVCEDQSKTTNNGKLNIKFQHIKSRVSFRIKLDKPIDEDEWGKVQVILSKLQISLADSKKIVYNTGRYKFEPKDGKPGYWDYSLGYYKAASGFVDLGLYSTQAYFYPQQSNSYVKDWVIMDAQPIVHDEYKNIFRADNPHFFIIPPTNEGITDAGDVVLIVEYIVSFYEEKNSQKNETSRLVRTSKVSLPLGTLKPGGSYCFNLIVNPMDNIVQVDPTVDIDPWEAEEQITSREKAETNSAEGIKAAWNKLAARSQSPDNNHHWYKIIVPGSLTATTFDLSDADPFKNASTAIELVFEEGGLYNGDASRLVLPTGYYLDTSISTKNIIRYKE